MRSARAGFTLVEMIISYGLTVMVMGGVAWALMLAFRVERVVEGELDLLGTGIHAIAKISTEAALSRGLVRFTPAGSTGTKDGLLVRGGKILVYEMNPTGELVKSIYNSGGYQLATQESLGFGFSYFHLVELEKGLNISLEMTGDLRSQYSSSLAWSVDFSTGIRARQW